MRACFDYNNHLDRPRGELSLSLNLPAGPLQRVRVGEMEAEPQFAADVQGYPLSEDFCKILFHYQTFYFGAAGRETPPGEYGQQVPDLQGARPPALPPHLLQVRRGGFSHH